ncbi:MAG TPA: YncE family protein [Vicinamibacterales bacterium]|nr:YncE family protein [Vicinamibacterales bacterium]
MARLLTLLALVVLAPLPVGQRSGSRLVVLNKEDAALVTVDPASGKVLGRVATGDAPHEVAVSADGRTAVVGNYGAQTPGSTLSVIDLAAMKETRRVDVSPLRRPHGVFFSGGSVYFTSETNRIIGRYDVAADRIDWLFGTGQGGTHMVWVKADASTIYACNIASDSISIIERGAGPLAWTQTVVPVGKGPEGFDVSPDGRQLWAAHSRDGGVSIVDLDQKKVIQTIDVKTKRSNRLKFTPDGRTVLISDLDAGELLFVDVASREVARRLPLGRMVEGILIEPGGARAFVAVNGDNYVAVVDLNARAVVARLETGRGPDGMAWIR